MNIKGQTWADLIARLPDLLVKCFKDRDKSAALITAIVMLLTTFILISDWPNWKSTNDIPMILLKLLICNGIIVLIGFLAHKIMNRKSK